MVAAFGRDLRVLDIDGRQSFAYESMYFDTPDLASYLGAAHGKRRRFKVRSRVYSDQETCVRMSCPQGFSPHLTKSMFPLRRHEWPA